jgi:tetrapyrrole methylase family protein/MazG family protein
MLPRIVVVGLGPGPPEYLTREAWEVLAGARVLYLRTGRHPLISHLPAHLEARVLDACCQQGPDSVQSYAQIVARLLEAPEMPVYYGVPGHPLIGEATTRLLLQRLGPGQVRVVAGLSFLEPVCTALGLDPLAQGLQLYDALDLAASEPPFVPPVPLDPTRPLLIGQVYDRLTASRVKLALLQHYPDEHPTTVVWAAGVPDQEARWQGPLHELDRSDLRDYLGTVYVPPLPRLAARREAATLEWICARLRGPGGCPWDREQDHASLRNNLLEECYEVLEALDQGDLGRLREELGDVLLQVYLHAQLAREEGAFAIADVFAGIAAKLIRRHPHVFGSLEVSGSAEVLRNWEVIKAAERTENGKQGASLLDSVPATLPALAQAQAIGRRVSRVGFDWARVEEVWTKVEEELAELREAPTRAERAEELGDVLFALVNLARWLDVEAEDALRATNRKFGRRFAWLEETARQRGVSLEQMGISEMDVLWEEAKSRGR